MLTFVSGVLLWLKNEEGGVGEGGRARMTRCICAVNMKTKERLAFSGAIVNDGVLQDRTYLILGQVACGQMDRCRETSQR